MNGPGTREQFCFTESHPENQLQHIEDILEQHGIDWHRRVD